MTSTIYEIATAILISTGAAGGLIFGLSSFLAKVWANRILDRERNELAVLKETLLKEHNEKFATYKSAVDVIAKLLADLDRWKAGQLPPDQGLVAFHEFNEKRIRLYGYLGMIAPQAVMDANDLLIDHLLQVSLGETLYDWEKIRELSLNLLNEIRKDVAVDKKAIVYNGRR
jgi:hypothetical protein